MHVFQLRRCCLIAGGVAELNFRILGSSLDHVILMAKTVGEDDLASLFRKVYCRVITALILRNVVLADDLILRKPQSFDHTVAPQHVSVGVTFLLIANEDKTYLEVSGINRFCCACCQRGAYGHSRSHGNNC